MRASSELKSHSNANSDEGESGSNNSAHSRSENIKLVEFDFSPSPMQDGSPKGVQSPPAQTKSPSLFFSSNAAGSAGGAPPLLRKPSLFRGDGAGVATEEDYAEIAEFLRLGGASAVADSVVTNDEDQPLHNTLPSYELSTSETGTRFAYEVFFILLIVFNFLEIPFRVAFQPPLPLGYYVLGSIIDFLFILDLVLRFFLPYQHARGYFVFDRQAVRLHYLKTWFTPDIVSSVPWDFITLLLYATNYENAAAQGSLAFRYLRLTRLTRVFHVSTRLKKWEVTLDISSTFFRLTRLLLLVLLWLHFFACFWFLIAEESGYPSSSWAAKETLQAADITTQYISSMYWSVTTFTTVGYGDLTPGNNGERIYAIFTMLFAVFIMSYITGNVVSWLQSSEAQRQELSEQLSYYKRYLKYRDLPEDLGGKVLKYFRLQGLTKFYKFDDKDVLMKLTPALRTEVCWHLKDSLLADWELLEDKSPSFVTSCVLRLKRESRSPGESICMQGNRANKFFVLTSGLAAVIKDGHWIATLAPGAQFGEAALFTAQGLRKATVVAQTPCELFSLKSSDVSALLTMFPDYKQSFEIYAANKMEAYQRSTDTVAAAARDATKRRKVLKVPRMGRKKPSTVAVDKDLTLVILRAKETLSEEFSGKELVNFLVKAIKTDRLEATVIGERLNAEGVLVHSTDYSREFRDSLAVYRWVTEDDPETTPHKHHQIAFAPTTDVHSLLRQTAHSAHHKKKSKGGAKEKAPRFDGLEELEDFEERDAQTNKWGSAISIRVRLTPVLSESLEAILRSHHQRKRFKRYLASAGASGPADAHAASFIHRSGDYSHAESRLGKLRVLAALVERYVAEEAPSSARVPGELVADALQCLRQTPVREADLDAVMIALQQHCVDRVEPQVAAFLRAEVDAPGGDGDGDGDGGDDGGDDGEGEETTPLTAARQIFGSTVSTDLI